MSEITDLKQKILQRLAGIKDRQQLRLVHKILDRLEEVEQCLKHNEPSLTRGHDAGFFRSKLKMKEIASISEEGRALLEYSLSKLEELEGQLAKT